MSLKPEQVDHIADLARIELTDEERDRFREQLSTILEYRDRLLFRHPGRTGRQ